jgi:hypothetical protein
MTDITDAYPSALPVTVPSQSIRVDRPDRLLFVEDPDAGTVLVRWRLTPSEFVWRCGSCGPMAAAECVHTFSAGLFLATDLLGLTPAIPTPESQLNPTKGTSP